MQISDWDIKEAPLIELFKELDAVKIHFKAFTDKFYKVTYSGELKPGARYVT